MSKIEIIKAIAEQSHHKSVTGIFGKVIVDACVEELKKGLDLGRIKSMFESAKHLIEQIEFCDSHILTLTNYINQNSCLNDIIDPDGIVRAAIEEKEDFIQLRNNYTEQLTNLLNEL